MKRPLLKRVIPQMMAWAGVVLLCAVVALAQDNGTATAPANGQRTDGQIEMDVVQALDASQALKNDLITAATIQSQVTLSGTVSSQASKDLAGLIAAHVNGVTKVNNNLTVGNPQDAQDASQYAAPAPDADAQAMNDNSQPGIAPQPGDQQQPAPQAQPAYPQAQPYPPAQQPYPNYPPPPPARPEYQRQNGYNQPQQAPAPAYQMPSGPVTLPAGTLLQVRTAETIDNKRATDGTPVEFTVIRDVNVGGLLAIPRGATVHGVVSESKQAGQLSGRSELALTLTSLDLGGQSYPITSDQFRVKGPDKTGRTVGNAFGGALLGAIIGGAVGRGAGAAIGAGAGAAAGTAVTAATPGPNVWIPSEALVTFHLQAPITVQPVNAQEAARLAQGLYAGGPSLYRRGPYQQPYRYAGGPYYPYYAYPPVYYRPYYMVGGVYYWR
ncbi:MAG TPA: BON domain-containing protein [Terracidiphilus sp.]|nr:BON domain-containing protein [Terracidiphilus sp.]